MPVTPGVFVPFIIRFSIIALLSGSLLGAMLLDFTCIMGVVPVYVIVFCLLLLSVSRPLWGI